jgi:hypothetical protein
MASWIENGVCYAADPVATEMIAITDDGVFVSRIHGWGDEATV